MFTFARNARRGLYGVEREAKETGLDAAGRRALRQEKARPLLAELRDGLAAMAPRATPKSPLGHAQKRWAALTRYLEDGRLEIDNGEVERLIRLVALGRKNFLLAGSDPGAERAAVAYTVLATCTLHELDPWAYVADVLEKIAGDWPQREIDRLLPEVWAQGAPRGASPLAPGLNALPSTHTHTARTCCPRNRGGPTRATMHLRGRLPSFQDIPFSQLPKTNRRITR